MTTVTEKKETRIVLDLCEARRWDEATMARFTAENLHLVQVEYEFWASRNNTAKKEDKKKMEEGEADPYTVVGVSSDEESGSDIDWDNL